ncbi:MAG: hypothetical protein WKF50_08300 [Nocardioides sp.]
MTTATAVRERGYSNAGTGFWASLATAEHVPELRWPQCLRVYNRMQTDAQVSSVLQAVAAPIMRTTWSLNGRGVDREVTENIARSIGLPIKGDDVDTDFSAQLRGRDRFSWTQHLVEALEHLPVGHSVFEQVYRYDDQGLAQLRKLGFRPAHTLSKWNIADDGGIVSIEQHPRALQPGRTNTGKVTLPVGRLVVYSHGRRGADWLGRSVLRACYKNWILKDDGNRTWAISLQRNGMGVPVHKAGTNNQADIDAGLEVAAKARAGDMSGISVGKDGDFGFKGVEGGVTDANAFVRYQDEQIARAVLAHFLNLGAQSGSGSYALGTVQANFFTLSLQAIAEEIRDVANRHIVEDLVDLNFGPTVPAPRIEFAEIGTSVQAHTALDKIRADAGLEDDDEMADFINNNVAAAA